MLDDDWALGENEVDVRNEALRFPGIFACESPEQQWIEDLMDASRADGREDTSAHERSD